MEENALAEVLLGIMGTGHELQIDGVGGGAPTTSKAALICLSDHEWADVDFCFVQVSVEERSVDFSPSCGNILAGVGPFAIEEGLVPAREGETAVRVRNTNTGSLVEIVVQTPGKRVEYAGDTAIDGVPGSSAPIALNFMNIVGAKTGALLPTGQVVDVIEGIEVSCVDVAMPVVFARAVDFGLSGYEEPAVLDANRDLAVYRELIRQQAGCLMGLGEVADKVVPKFALLTPPRAGGNLCGRYFTPLTCHPSFAVTGAICAASCFLRAGTVADRVVSRVGSPVEVKIEHPSGAITVKIEGTFDDPDSFRVDRAGIVRTARLIWKGELYVPGSRNG